MNTGKAGMFPGRSGEKMESLRSKVILVTGANGFIGSHLTRRLLKKEQKSMSY